MRLSIDLLQKILTRLKADDSTHIEFYSVGRGSINMMTSGSKNKKYIHTVSVTEKEDGGEVVTTLGYTEIME